MTKISLIGLDTSHTVEFARRIAAPDCPAEQRIEDVKVTGCLRFSTPFQSEEGLNGRQKQLEDWGITVTTDFDKAVADCDAIAMTINDPAYHLEYFRKCVALSKPIFVDKPFADNIENGRIMAQLAAEKNVKVVSSSSLRYAPALLEACKAMPEPLFVTTYGPLGIAPAGSSVIWYGVHSFEMLQRAIGRGAETLKLVETKAGAVITVDYENGRQGVVELAKGMWLYGGCLRGKDNVVTYRVDANRLYTDQFRQLVPFFKGGEPPVAIEDTLEVMALLDAAERSLKSGKKEKV